MRVSLQSLTRFTASVDRWLPLLILTAVAVGVVYPRPWLALQPFGAYIVAYNVFVASLGIQWGYLQGIAHQWRALLGAFALLYLGVPIVALGVATLLPDRELIAGLLVLATLPVGAMAIVWSDIEGGNVALGLTLLAASTLACAMVSPLVLYATLRKVITVDLSGLGRGLAVTIVLPALAALALNSIRTSRVRQLRPALQPVVRVNTLLMVLATSAGFRDHGWVLWSLEAVLIVAAVVLQILLGFALGYIAAGFLVGDAFRDRLSIMLASSMRNNIAGMVIANAWLSPKAAIPSAVALLVQQPLAGLVCRSIRLYRNRRERAKSGTVSGEDGPFDEARKTLEGGKGL